MIKTGITSISDNAFASLPVLEEVEIEKGMQKIGKEAFAYCKNLRTVTLPASVISIGKDFVLTGSYWWGNDYAKHNSYY